MAGTTKTCATPYPSSISARARAPVIMLGDVNGRGSSLGWIRSGRCQHFRVDRRGWRLACQGGEQVAYGQLPHPSPGLRGGGTDMGQAHHVGQVEEWLAGGGRFGLEDIEGGASDGACSQGLGQRPLVDQLALGRSPAVEVKKDPALSGPGG